MLTRKFAYMKLCWSMYLSFADMKFVQAANNIWKKNINFDIWYTSLNIETLLIWWVFVFKFS